MVLSILLLIAGLAILVYGGDKFVRGSASLARKLNVSPIVIGLTVVAFGTSAPELVVNIFSALKGAPDLAIGNVLGSNISNIFLVLGIAAVINPLTVKKGTTWKEIPFGILALVVLYFLGNDMMLSGASENMLTRGDGLVLVSFFVIFAVYTYGLTKVEGEKSDVKVYNWPLSILYILGGIAFLVLGGKLMVDNGVILARMAGLSELFIGLTIVAVGTSLPELVTSAIAAYRKQVDLAVGNVVGSNIFNVLWVLGLTPLVAPLELNPNANFDIYVAGLGAVLLFAFLLKKRGPGHRHMITKWEGLVFIGLYLFYIVYVSIRG